MEELHIPGETAKLYLKHVLVAQDTNRRSGCVESMLRSSLQVLSSQTLGTFLCPNVTVFLGFQLLHICGAAFLTVDFQRCAMSTIQLLLSASPLSLVSRIVHTLCVG